MRYVGFAIAVSLFIFFFAAVIMFTTNYFSRYSGLTKTAEINPVAESLFNVLLKRKGVPEDWDQNYSISPVKVGLMEDLYMVPVVVRETNGSARTNEPVTVRVNFDEDCQNKSWNTTVRLYDEDDNELNIEISNTTFCTSQFLNVSNITWDVNISANQIKNYYLYYSPDEDVTDPCYTSLAYNTSSWIPNDRDEWTENTKDWSILTGSGQVTNDTTYKIRGNSSVNVTASFGSTYFNLIYNPANDILGISNNCYLDLWLYIDDVTELDYLYMSLYHNITSYIYTDILSDLTNNTWYHFERELDPSLWTEFGTFDASEGIDIINFGVYNSTPDLTRTLKIDGLHFKKKPLNVKTFPEEKIEAISYNKFDTMQNLSYDELKKTIGESYKFSVKIDEETYGGWVNQSADAVCYQNPSMIQYSNGTVKNIVPKLCVWK